MTHPLTHEEVDALLGAYALDAVDADETILIEDHLRECSQCRAELASYRETATQLAHESVAPPPLLWDRVAAALDMNPPVLDIGRVMMRHRKWTVAWRVVGVAAAALVITLTAVAVHQQRELDHVQVALDRDRLASAALAAFDSPGARNVTLISQDGHTQARAVVLTDGSGYMLGQQLPTIDRARTYQLWAIVDGKPISAGILGTQPDVTAFHIDQRASALAVTEEPAGGVVQPTAAPIVTGSITV